MRYYEVQDTEKKLPLERVYWDSHEGAVARYLLMHQPPKGADYWDIAVNGDITQHNSLLVADDAPTVNPDTDGDELYGYEEYVDGEQTLYHAFDMRNHQRTPLGSFWCLRASE